MVNQRYDSVAHLSECACKTIWKLLQPLPCYPYAIGSMFGSYLFRSPGFLKNPSYIESFQTRKSYIKTFLKKDLTTALTLDGCISAGKSEVPPPPKHGHYLIGAFYKLATRRPDPKILSIPYNKQSEKEKEKACEMWDDYHFVRQHILPDSTNGSLWSHKHGGLPPQFIHFKKPISGFSDLQKNFPAFSFFNGWYYIPNEGISISVDSAIRELADKSPEALHFAKIKKELIEDFLKQNEVFQRINKNILESFLNPKASPVHAATIKSALKDLPYPHPSQELCVRISYAYQKMRKSHRQNNF